MVDQIDVLVGHIALGRIADGQYVDEAVHRLGVVAFFVVANRELHLTRKIRVLAGRLVLSQKRRRGERERAEDDDDSKSICSHE